MCSTPSADYPTYTTRALPPPSPTPPPHPVLSWQGACPLKLLHTYPPKVRVVVQGSQGEGEAAAGRFSGPQPHLRQPARRPRLQALSGLHTPTIIHPPPLPHSHPPTHPPTHPPHAVLQKNGSGHMCPNLDRWFSYLV